MRRFEHTYRLAVSDEVDRNIMRCQSQQPGVIDWIYVNLPNQPSEDFRYVDDEVLIFEWSGDDADLPGKFIDCEVRRVRQSLRGKEL